MVMATTEELQQANFERAQALSPAAAAQVGSIYAWAEKRKLPMDLIWEAAHKRAKKVLNEEKEKAARSGVESRIGPARRTVQVFRGARLGDSSYRTLIERTAERVRLE